MANDQRRPGPYELFALALSVVAILLLGTTTLVRMNPETERIVDLADLVLCGLFFLDFVGNVVRAPNRLRYLYTWGWLDLAASIPAVDALRVGRFGRIVRVLRVLRMVKAGRMLTMALTSHRRESAVWAALLVFIVVLFTASIAVLEMEREVGNIKRAEDAMWWSLTTIATVGYGDYYPVTTGGRLVATGLMFVGVSVFGTLSGLVAGWFASPAGKREVRVVEDQAATM
jgi:voltage-gated potassium channel